MNPSPAKKMWSGCMISRAWSLTVDQIAMTAHLAVNPISDDVKEDILQQAIAIVRDRFKIYMSTIQVEDYKAQVMNCCDKCNVQLE